MSRHIESKPLTVAYISDNRYFEDQHGNWYTTASFPLADFVKAFPPTLRTWRFFGRLQTLPPDVPGFFPINPPQGIKVEFHGPRFQLGELGGFLAHFLKYRALIQECVLGADIVWAKQSFVATLIALWTKKPSSFVVTHLVGDPGDTLELRRGPLWRSIARLSRYLNRRVLKNADVCLFVSKALQDRYALPDKPNVVVHDGRISTSQLVDSFKHDKPSPAIIMYVGRLSHEKGVDILMRAFAEAIGSSQIKMILKIIGDGPEKEQLVSLAVILGIRDQAVFAGRISWGPSLFKEMHEATVLVLPSFTEGFGLVLLESLSQATPVIASDVGGVKECIANGEAGLLVPAGDCTALAKAIVLLVSDRKLQLQLAERGLRHAAQNTLEYQVEKLRTIFTEMYQSKT